MVLDDGFQEAGGSWVAGCFKVFAVFYLLFNLLSVDQLYMTAVNHLCKPVLWELS